MYCPPTLGMDSLNLNFPLKSRLHIGQTRWPERRPFLFFKTRSVVSGDEPPPPPRPLLKPQLFPIPMVFLFFFLFSATVTRLCWSGAEATTPLPLALMKSFNFFSQLRGYQGGMETAKSCSGQPGNPLRALKAEADKLRQEKRRASAHCKEAHQMLWKPPSLPEPSLILSPPPCLYYMVRPREAFSKSHQQWSLPSKAEATLLASPPPPPGKWLLQLECRG